MVLGLGFLKVVHRDGRLGRDRAAGTVGHGFGRMVLSDDLLQPGYHAGLFVDLVSHLLALLVELSIV